MALITVNGTIRDVNGGFPVSGQIKFELSNDMVNAAGVVVAKAPSYVDVSAINGTFTASLESTIDATPSDRYYKATFVGVMESSYQTELLGKFVLTATPTTQNLSAIIDMVSSGTTVVNFDSNNIAFIQLGTGAVERTARDKMRDFVHVKDFGAVGDGTTDDYTAFTRAFTAFDSVHVTQGTYKLGSNFTLAAGKTMIIEEGALIAPASTKTFSVSGFVEAGPYRIFSGAGLVDFAGSRLQKILWVEWWGAKGDTSTDCTSAINAAFVAVPNGSTMRFASNRQYWVYDVILLDHKFQVTLLGNDGDIGYADPFTKSEVAYKGGVAGVEATLKMNNCYACTVKGMIWDSNDGVDATKGTLRGIYITFTAGGSPGLSSRNKIINNTINAYNSQSTWVGIDIDNLSGSNNEHHAIIENLIQGGNSGIVNNSTIGIRLGHAQVKAIEIYRNNVSSVGTGVSVQGSMRAQDNSFNSVYSVWSFGYLADPAFVIGDDIETCHRYITTNQHPGGNNVTFIDNRVSNIAATGDTSDEYWVKTVGKFTFIGGSMINDSFYNVRLPGPFVFQGDGGESAVTFNNVTIQSGQTSMIGIPLGLETMNALVIDGTKMYKFGGNAFDFGGTNQQAVPTDYITRRTINMAGPSASAFSGLYIGDGDIQIAGLYQEYNLTATVVGVAGSTTYHLAVVGVDSLGRRSFTSLGPDPGNNDLYIAVTTANATLSGSNYITLQWPSQPARPPATWSIYEVNTGNPFQWRPVATGITNTTSVLYQTYNMVANPSGSFVTRPFMNETSEVAVTGKFLQPNSLTFTDADTTPSVAIGNRFTAANTGATSVTTFDDGAEGQTIYIRCTNANTTFVHGASLKNKSAGNVTAAANTVKSYHLFSSVWYEQS